jgi:8-oxo-dGTP pyrophosphatase MutT (NUDIX family)
MSEPLTQEQVERACIGLLNDAAIKGNIGLTTTIVLLSAHDAALREQLATARREVWEEAAKDLSHGLPKVWKDALIARCVFKAEQAMNRKA